jgi:hypothetical protein
MTNYYIIGTYHTGVINVSNKKIPRFCFEINAGTTQYADLHCNNPFFPADLGKIPNLD